MEDSTNLEMTNGSIVEVKEENKKEQAVKLFDQIFGSKKFLTITILLLIAGALLIIGTYQSLLFLCVIIILLIISQTTNWMLISASKKEDIKKKVNSLKLLQVLSIALLVAFIFLAMYALIFGEDAIGNGNENGENSIGAAVVAFIFAIFYVLLMFFLGIYSWAFLGCYISLFVNAKRLRNALEDKYENQDNNKENDNCIIECKNKNKEEVKNTKVVKCVFLIVTIIVMCTLLLIIACSLITNFVSIIASFDMNVNEGAGAGATQAFPYKDFISLSCLMAASIVVLVSMILAVILLFKTKNMLKNKQVLKSSNF